MGESLDITVGREVFEIGQDITLPFGYGLFLIYSPSIGLTNVSILYGMNGVYRLSPADSFIEITKEAEHSIKIRNKFKDNFTFRYVYIGFRK